MTPPPRGPASPSPAPTLAGGAASGPAPSWPRPRRLRRHFLWRRRGFRPRGPQPGECALVAEVWARPPRPPPRAALRARGPGGLAAVAGAAPARPARRRPRSPEAARPSAPAPSRVGSGSGSRRSEADSARPFCLRVLTVSPPRACQMRGRDAGPRPRAAVAPLASQGSRCPVSPCVLGPGSAPRLCLPRRRAPTSRRETSSSEGWFPAR